MNQNYKYQCLFIGNRDSVFHEIEEGLKKKFNELHIPLESLLCSFNDVSIIKGNQPTVIIVCHTEPNLPEEYKHWIQSNKLGVDVILPIYFKDFSTEVEDETLKRYNGIKYESPQIIISIILEGFNLLRKQRKLFISYKRSDSRDTALQLYNFFEERNFDVFLDSHSIPRGVDFQENLFHKMIDCDAVLLLDSKDFLESKYCREELEKAIANRIGILRLKWPDSTNPDYLGLIDLFNLNDGCFKGNVLTEKTLVDLALRIESLRVRTLASRQDALTTEFIETANRKGAKAVQVYPNIIQLFRKNTNALFFAAIGVPTSETFQHAESLLHKLLNSDTEFTLIYDDLMLLKYWISHLDWLCRRSHLSVLKKSEFENRIIK